MSVAALPIIFTNVLRFCAARQELLLFSLNMSHLT